MPIQIPLLGLKTATWRLFNPSNYVNGRWVDAGYTDTPIRVSIQPIKVEAEMLPGGERVVEQYRCQTYARVTTVDQFNKKVASQIIWNNMTYKVIGFPFWNELTGHTEFEMVRLQEGTS